LAADDPARRQLPSGYLNDTWEWNGTNWTQIITPVAPSARIASAMAYDPIGGGIVLFSGFGNTADTWYSRSHDRGGNCHRRCLRRPAMTTQWRPT
jgi:hypothetical protein